MLPLKTLSPKKEQRIPKGHKEKNATEGSGTKMVSDRSPRVSIWNPSVKLDEAPLPLDFSISDFPKRQSGLYS